MRCRVALASSTCARSLDTRSPNRLTRRSQSTETYSIGVAFRRPSRTARGRITGHVLCDDTHRPARGAFVLLVPVPAPGSRGIPPGATTTMNHVGSDGTYSIEHLPPGEYTVLAFFPGYLSAADDVLAEQIEHEAPQTSLDRDLFLPNGTVSLRGTETANFDISLHRGAAISGRVLYSDGAPAAQITLVLENTAAKPPKDPAKTQEQEMNAALSRRVFTHQNFSTDDLGYFRLAGLQPGKYRLAATQDSSAPTEGGGDIDGMGLLFTGLADPHALRFYAGDTPHRAAAKVYELRAGDEVNGLEITLPTDALRQVRGTVTAKDGRTINIGDLTLTDNSDPTLVFDAKLQQDGTFLIPQVPAGNYTLAASNARIGEPGKTPAGTPAQFAPLKPTHAFADGSLTLLVKDNDLTDVSLTLDEVPMPKDTGPSPAPVTPDED